MPNNRHGHEASLREINVSRTQIGEAKIVTDGKKERAMPQPAFTSAPPKIILLATDLSGRCDRALDRAAQLARLWRARMIVLHVIEPRESILEQMTYGDSPSWRRPPDRTAVVMKQIRRDLLETLSGAEDLSDIEVRIEEGDPATKIDEVARITGAGLIVTGVARDETFGRQVLGTTVHRLIRKVPLPLLVVKSRARLYREVLVATDFSASSRHALDVAVAFFPDMQKTLFHAFEVPFPALLDKGNAREEFRAMEQDACELFLSAAGLSPEVRRNLRTVIEHGVPAKMVRDYMEYRNVALVVLCTHGRSAVYDVLIGSTANRILECSPGDVLLVRDPKSVKS